MELCCWTVVDFAMSVWTVVRVMSFLAMEHLYCRALLILHIEMSCLRTLDLLDGSLGDGSRVYGSGNTQERV